MADMSFLEKLFGKAAAFAALLALAACGAPQLAERSLNLHGAELDRETRDNVDRLTKYCAKLSAAGDLKTANGLCLRAHQLDPTNPLPIMLLAGNFERSGENDLALRSYQQVLVLHADNSEAIYRLAKLRLVMGQEQDAMNGLLAGLAHSPNAPRLLNIVGILHDLQGEHDAAQFYYREALVLGPENPYVNNNLGLSLALSGRPVEAVRLLERVIAQPMASETSKHNLDLAYEMVLLSPTDIAAQDAPGDGSSDAVGTSLRSQIASPSQAPLRALTTYISSEMHAVQEI